MWRSNGRADDEPCETALVKGGVVERQRVIGPPLGIALLGLAAWAWGLVAVAIGVAVAAAATPVFLRRPLPNAGPPPSAWRVLGVAAAGGVFGLMLSDFDLPTWILGTTVAVAGGIFLALGIRARYHPALRAAVPRPD